MNKLFKGLICYTIAICCHILCFAHSATENDSPLSVKLSPEKDIYYVGETVKLIFSLRIDEEYAEVEDINFTGLNNLSYAKFGEFFNVPSDETTDKQKHSFATFLTFTDAEEATLDIGAVYRYSIRDVRGNGFFVMKTMGPTKRAKAKPLSISIKELLPPPTDQFSGIVGSIDIYSTISTNIAAVGDIITVRTTIETSDLNIKDSLSCSIEHLENFKLYPEKIVQQGYTAENYGYVIEQTIVPNAPGEFTIPPPKVLYFDTTVGEYKFATEKINEEDQLTITITERKVEEVEDVILTPIGPDSNADASSTTNANVRTIDPATKQQITNIATMAKLAPSPNALNIFEIPANGQITVLEQHSGWYRVNYNNAFGWIPVSAIKSGE